MEKEKGAMFEYHIGEKAKKHRYFGVYETVADVPTFGNNPFDTEEWIETNKEYIYTKKTT